MANFFFGNRSNSEGMNDRDEDVAPNFAERHLIAFFYSENLADFFRQRDDVGVSPLAYRLCGE